MGNPILKEYTEEQKRNILSIYPSIEEYLNNTDYTVIKAYEYSITGKKIPEGYKKIFEKREEAREKIRKIEKGK